MKKFKDAFLAEEVKEGNLKNASQLKWDKNGIGLEMEIDGKLITIIVDKELPTTYICARFSEMITKHEKDIRDRI